MTDTATPTRITFTSKKQLALWLAQQGIQIAQPITLKAGWFHFVPVLPPSGGSRSYTMSFTILGGVPPKHTYRPEKVIGDDWRNPVPMTPEECALEDARINRMNEIESVLFYFTRNVGMRRG